MVVEFARSEIQRYRRRLKNELKKKMPAPLSESETLRYEKWKKTKSGQAALKHLTQVIESQSHVPERNQGLSRLASLNDTLPLGNHPTMTQAVKTRNENTQPAGKPSRNVPDKQSTNCSSKSAMNASHDKPIANATNKRNDSDCMLRFNSEEPDTEYPFEFPLHLKPSDLEFQKKTLGEGQTGKVAIAKYRNVLVACKYRRYMRSRRFFLQDIRRELFFASKLSACRFMNPYIGVLSCCRTDLNLDLNTSEIAPHRRRVLNSESKETEYFIIQRYYENGDLREYIEKIGRRLHPLEVLQLCISIFAAIADAHKLNIGMVDLKLENVLVDSSGSAWLTDFGSCIELGTHDVYQLNHDNVRWTAAVEAPEMRKCKQFRKASDVFMAFVILAEILTSDMSDNEFQRHVLIRQQNGQIELHTDRIHSGYNAFIPILHKGLETNYWERPTAYDALSYFEAMRKASIEQVCSTLFGYNMTKKNQTPRKRKCITNDSEEITHLYDSDSSTLSDYEAIDGMDLDDLYNSSLSEFKNKSVDTSEEKTKPSRETVESTHDYISDEVQLLCVKHSV